MSRSHYTRNTGSGRPVDTGPPRTNTGLTGLGAVGGRTGVGAGALRVIVEFLTQYDAKELKELESELQRLQGLENRHNTKLAALRKEEVRSQTALTRVQNIQQRAAVSFTRAQLKEIREIRDLERSGARGSIKEANQRKTLLAQQVNFRKAEISQLVNADRIAQKAQHQRALFATKIRGEEAKIAPIMERQAQAQQRIGFMQNLRANVAPKLGALALGAAGGVFGGAVVGIGFAAAEALISAVGAALRNILDPAHEAREALAGVAEEVNKIAAKEGVSSIDAAKIALQQYGEAGKNVNAELLAQAGATQALIEQNEKLAAILKVIEQAERLSFEAAKERVKLQSESMGLGDPGAASSNRILSHIVPDAFAESSRYAQLYGDEAEILAAVLRDLDMVSNSAANSASRLAAENLRAANAAAFSAVAHQSLSNALDRISNARITGLQDQLAGLSSSGPSARTSGIEAQIAGAQEAQAQAAYGAQLRNIQEERGLILLEQRIRFQGESVRLDQLSAQGQIIAIDARIEALQRANELDRERLEVINDQIKAMRAADEAQDKKDRAALEVFDKQIAAIREQGDAQERLNRLLDLQYRMSQRINRNQGESIGDFLARRANEQRSMLAEQASLRRDDAVSAIEQEKQKISAIQETANERREAAIEAKELEAEALQNRIEALEKARAAEIKALQQRQQELQLEVRLQKLAEQEKALAAQESARKQMQYLQEQLRASQAADAAAVKSKQDAINKQIAAEQERNKRVQYWINEENQIRLRGAISGANSLSDLHAIAGELAGAQRALGELRALVRAGVLEPYMASPHIAALVAIVRSAQSKMAAYSTPNINSNTPVPFAKGGVFMLNNAMNSPFGANIRTGEEGSEIGVVLSNRVARALKDSQRQTVGNQTFVINRSDDPYRDKQRFKGAVRDVFSEILG